MEQAAETLEFERAAKYRDQITQLRKIQEQQYVHAASGDVDVFAVALASGAACVQGMFIRGGRLARPSHVVSAQRTRGRRRRDCSMHSSRSITSAAANVRFRRRSLLSHPIVDVAADRVCVARTEPDIASRSRPACAANARAGSTWRNKTRSCRSTRISPTNRTCSRASSICRRRSGSKICPGTTRVFRHQPLQRRSNRCIVRRLRQQRSAEIGLSPLQHRGHRGG